MKLDKNQFALAIERDVPNHMRVAYDCGRLSRECGDHPFGGHRALTPVGVRWWRLGYVDYGRDERAGRVTPRPEAQTPSPF